MSPTISNPALQNMQMQSPRVATRFALRGSEEQATYQMGLLPLISPINSLVRSEDGGSRCHGSLRLDKSIWSYKTEMAPDSEEKETNDWAGVGWGVGTLFDLNVARFVNWKTDLVFLENKPKNYLDSSNADVVMHRGNNEQVMLKITC